MNRRTLLATLAFALAFQGPLAAQVVNANPRCVQAQVALITRLDSSFSEAGDAFTFRTVDEIAATGTTPAIEAGTIGFGVVALAQHAASSGVGGVLVLEPRFLRLADGTRFPVMADPSATKHVARVASRDMPGVVEFVPFVGWAASGYNALHHGKDVTLTTGMRFRVIVGDDLAAAKCYVPPT